jgi:endoglycosylceramidase
MRKAVTVALALMVVALVPSAAAATGSPVRGPVHRADRWLVDDQGRVVVLHGFNVVQKNPPYVRTEFGKQDARLLARNGFTVVRLPFLWAGVEPEPGEYDDAYIRSVLRIDSLLARYGIRTLVGFHQDGWSASSAPAFGDGAPPWADLGADPLADFAAFWRNDPGPDGVGIQDHFLGAWHHVAKALRGRSNITGIDPFNEPYPGSDYPPPCGTFTRCPAFETGALADFYGRVAKAIRSAGAEQVIFPEGIADSATEPPVLPKLSDRQSAFNYHYYCTPTQLSPLEVPVGAPSPQAEACLPLEQTRLGRFASYAQSLHVPGFLSEFSCNDVNPDNAQVVDLVAQTFTSWTAWAYYPKNQGSDCTGQGLLREAGNPSSAKQDKLEALALPYAVAIAGKPRGTSLNRSRDIYRLAYRSDGVRGADLKAGASTIIYVPRRMYPDGYVARAQSAEIRSGDGAQWLRVAADPGRRVSVAVKPR